MGCYLLAENGDFLTAENGDRLLLDGCTPSTTHHGGASLEWDEEQFRLWLENPRRVVIDAEEEELVSLLSTL